jgi:hypothetical protein
MSKRLLAGIAPLLALVAFAIAPAMAQASTEYGTETAGVFTAFAARTEVVSAKSGAAPFVLENKAKTADIECSTFSDEGDVENVAGVGKSENDLTFDNCVGSGLLAGCVPNAGTGVINGVVLDKVTAATKVEVTIKEGFEIECFGINLGTVTGAVKGTQAKKTNILTFTKAKGLEFNKEPATITGADATVTKVGAKPVVIN